MNFLVNLKLKTIGYIISGTILVSFVIISSSSIFSISSVRGLGESWGGFAEGPVKKAAVLSELRSNLGYGGMIHQFKNYVLRLDAGRVQKVESKVSASLAAIAEYRSLGVNAQESKALEAIEMVTQDYMAALQTAVAMAAQGGTPTEIDGAVKINDTPALDAMKVLDERLLAASKTTSARVDEAVSSILTFAIISGIILALIMAVLAAGVIWFTRWRLALPIERLSSTMATLASGDNSVAVPQVDRKDEIGEMAKAVLVFKENGIENERLAAEAKKAAEAEEKRKQEELDRERKEMEERKRAEEKLRQSERKYRNIIDTTSEGFWWIGEDLRINEVNDAICRMLGYSRDQILGNRPFDFVDGIENPELKARIKEGFLQRVEARNCEVRFAKQDGSPLDAHISATNFVDQDGNPSGRFVFITDLTEQKERDAQLQQAQKMEALGQLTGGVAHEFNNLLLVIVGNIEVLESQLGKDDPLQSFASSAMKGALRGAELTQSLLAFSRKQRLKSGRVDLNGLVLGMQNLFERTLGEAITIEADLAEGLWPTSADAGQIEAALLNFVLNARDAMPDGGAITIRTSNRVMTADTAAHYDCVEPGEYVALEVSDTGTGMTDEQIERAFEPFYTTKEVGKGTGLGLSVAYGFAKQSGGCLEIESEPDQGTTMRLSLPRAVGEEAAAEQKQGTSPKAVTGSGTILVLEDDAAVRALVVRQLSRLGYEVFAAEDGPEALALLEGHPDFDLLFSDVMLPGGMSGPQAAAQAQTKHPDLKVLLTSGNPEKDAEDLAVNGKDVPILRKPYRKSELAEAIAAAMSSE